MAEPSFFCNQLNCQGCVCVHASHLRAVDTGALLRGDGSEMARPQEARADHRERGEIGEGKKVAGWAHAGVADGSGSLARAGAGTEGSGR
jgi:hypothetical protein